ncbi:hypothetical protein AgCh_004351 [Apium graveolens]
MSSFTILLIVPVLLRYAIFPYGFIVEQAHPLTRGYYGFSDFTEFPASFNASEFLCLPLIVLLRKTNTSEKMGRSGRKNDHQGCSTYTDPSLIHFLNCIQQMNAILQEQFTAKMCEEKEGKLMGSLFSKHTPAPDNATASVILQNLPHHLMFTYLLSDASYVCLFPPPTG